MYKNKMISSHRVARDLCLIVNERVHADTRGRGFLCFVYPSACRAHDATREHITTDERDEQHRIIGYSTHSVRSTLCPLVVCGLLFTL